MPEKEQKEKKQKIERSYQRSFEKSDSGKMPSGKTSGWKNGLVGKFPGRKMDW